MKFEGRITEEADPYGNNGKPRLMVDAEPHVMQRIRKIFDNAQNYFNRGLYTHKPILFPNNMSACRDLVWVMDRYNLEVNPDLLKSIVDKANEYDSILKSISDADKDTSYRVSKDALKLALPLRPHQVQFNNMFNKVRKMLLADKMGLGKTSSAISLLCEPERRPALVVVPTTLCTQWENEVKRFLPDASTHVIRGFKNYELPKVDVLITSYNRLQPWQDVLLDGRNFKTAIFDEVHELRHTGTGKRHVARTISETVEYCAGLSGTPIFNMGDEIWSVLDAIKPDCLGDYSDFESEWTTWGRVNEPATLNSFLKKQGLFLRRDPEEVGLKFGEASKHVFTIDADLDKLKEVQNVAKMLALSVLSGNVGEDSDSAREFDWKLRQATGIAKAKPVAEFVKMLVDSGEKVVLAGWHRAVYEVWEKELASCNPVMFTGSETVREKETAVNKFVKGDAKVFIISLRSGAGLDGLQHACNTVVFGELDWTSNVHDQVIARVDRDGQTKHVQAYYLTIADGSDPFIINLLGVKRSQHDGLVEGKQSEGGVITQSAAGKDRIKEMATAYLRSIGEDIPESVAEEGLLGDLARLVRSTKLPVNSEEEMQEALNTVLRDNLKNAKVEREFKITKRSRLDFLVSNENEKIAVECKIEQTGRPEVYRQVRRYAEEGKITSLVLVAPWFGISSFKVDSVPVIVVDTSINSI
ncbi:unnamed protein product [Sphagnum balticum]